MNDIQSSDLHSNPYFSDFNHLHTLCFVLILVLSLFISCFRLQYLQQAAEMLCDSSSACTLGLLCELCACGSFTS
jgi:hypothetical protein